MTPEFTFSRKYPTIDMAVATVGVFFFCGTSGLVQPESFESTGSTPFIVGSKHADDRDKYTKTLEHGSGSQSSVSTEKQIQTILQDFGFTKAQLASALGVTRVTLDKWFSARTQNIRKDNLQRLFQVNRVLVSICDEEVTRPFLGKLLRDSLDEEVVSFVNALNASEFDSELVIELSRNVRPRVEGKRVSESLDALLENSPTVG